MKANPILGERIRQYRIQNSMTQKELASEIGVEALHITKVENGKRGISSEKLKLICKCFRINLHDLLPQEYEVQPDDSELRQQWEKEIVSAIGRLDTAQLGMVRTMLCALFKE